jgi:hypothetical protein
MTVSKFFRSSLFLFLIIFTLLQGKCTKNRIDQQEPDVPMSSIACSCIEYVCGLNKWVSSRIARGGVAPASCRLDSFAAAWKWKGLGFAPGCP